MKQRWLWISLGIPVVGLLLLVARAEYAVRSGDSWLIPITGYDPRDLLYGRFLRYQYKFNWQGYDSCRSTWMEDEHQLSPGCCLCLKRSNEQGFDPPVRQVQCEQAQKSCDGWLRSEAVMPPLEYFVPEDRALDLENELRTRAAALKLTCGPDGAPAISDLYLDGRPWREALAIP